MKKGGKMQKGEFVSFCDCCMLPLECRIARKMARKYMRKVQQKLASVAMHISFLFMYGTLSVLFYTFCALHVETFLNVAILRNKQKTHKI